MSHLGCFPTRILMGENSLEQLSNLLVEFESKNVLLVTDMGLTKAGLVDVVINRINKTDVRLTIYNETQPEPTIANFKGALKLVENSEIDLVIGLGGGSSIDLAKAVALMIKHKDSEFLDYVGINKVPSPGLPTIMISTTSGTGSEVSKFAVLTDEMTHLKSVIASPNIVAKVAIVDPKLTYSLPKVITAHTGMDALVHCIEGYLATRSSDFSDDLALAGIGKIWENLYKAFSEPNNSEARYQMSLGSMYGGLVLNVTDGAGMVHGLAFSLGVYCNLPHGLANSVMLPYTLEYLAPYCEDRLVKLANTIGISKETNKDTINTFILEIVEYQKKLEIPTSLEQLNISRDLLMTLSESSVQQERLQTNSPKRLSTEEIFGIFSKSYSQFEVVE